MIRIASFDKYEEELRIKFQRFFNEAKTKMLDFSDFLVCQQGGFYDWGGYPCIGFGEVGLNNLQKVNIINNIGISICTSDDNYFKKNGDIFLMELLILKMESLGFVICILIFGKMNGFYEPLRNYFGLLTVSIMTGD